MAQSLQEAACIAEAQPPSMHGSLPQNNSINVCVQEQAAHLLEAPQHEGPQHSVQARDEGGADGGGALHHAGEGVAEPVLELRVGVEDVGHEEVHERPQLHEVVLHAWRMLVFQGTQNQHQGC